MRGIKFLLTVVGVLLGVLLSLGVVSIVGAILIPNVLRDGDLRALDGDALPIICITLVVIVGIATRTIIHLEKGRSRNTTKEHDPEESRLIQEMHRSLTRMEERIEALETLYMDKAREDSFSQRL